MKKIFLLFCFTVLVFQHTRAQVSLLATVNAKGGFIRGSSFQRFAESYNALNTDNKTKLKNFGAAYGYSFSGDLFLGDESQVYMSYYQHKLMANTSTQINDMYSRDFHLIQNSYGCDIGGGRFNDGVGGCVFIGIYFATANLKTGIKYTDGYTSYGSDGLLNGIYHTYAFSGALGAKFIATSGPVGFTAALRWSPMFGSGEFYDFGKTDNQIPEDWKTYVNSGAVSYQYSGKYLKANLQSVSLDLGLAFRLISD